MSESFLLFLVIVLFFLAISDLIVGVSNDAVNFLNSAVGAKVASFRTIMIIAAVGVVIGATFSSGMMEVARKGIMAPEMFTMKEVMVIFLAVMITDVILLDTFNTYGLPTSTTVSIVFELLGASVSVALIKINMLGESLGDLDKYINSDKALAIIVGILLSVAIAFLVGAIIQWFSRLIFSFQYKRRLKYFGSLFGGVALAAITWFLLIKGAKGSSLITKDQVHWVSEHALIILASSFVIWTVLFQLLSSVFKFNILKFVILVGTFALAMAFAGNDLVNFIGVPLAGLATFQEYLANPGIDPNQHLMTSLAEPVRSNTLLLLVAGLIMVLTLFINKKARSVIDTTVDLSRQGEGDERFAPNDLSRGLVRVSMQSASLIKKLVPGSVRKYINKQFQQDERMDQEVRGASFDHIRASVNLVVASILIAIGTSRKLPLSTTYVTFMVAMGTSLADRAWGRESAVYRITGVLSVVGGWFLTAFAAFSVSFLIAQALFYGKLVAVILLIVLAIFFVIRTHFIHKRRSEQKKSASVSDDDLNKLHAALDTKNKISKTVDHSFSIIDSAFKAFRKENLRDLRKSMKKIREIDSETELMRKTLFKALKKIETESVDTGHTYVEIIDYTREFVVSLNFIVKPLFEHVSNNHKPLLKEQESELQSLLKQLKDVHALFSRVFGSDPDVNKAMLLATQENINKQILECRKLQISRISNQKTSTRNSLLYMNFLQECSNLTHHLVSTALAFKSLEQSS